MATLYCIPGLGTDERVFSRLFPFLEQHHTCVVLNHIEPLSRQESLAHYAQRLGGEIPMPQEKNFVLLGLSLGGPIAIEIAKQYPNAMVILISTFKQTLEEPFLFKIARVLPLYRLIHIWYTHHVIPCLARLFHIGSQEDSTLLGAMFQAHSAAHFAWGRRAIVHWKNKKLPNICWHLNGDKDHIFNNALPYVDACIIGGTHNMILDRAEEVAIWLLPILEEIDYPAKAP